MKKLLYTLAAVLVPSLAMAQTYTENFVKSTTHQVKTKDGEHRAGTTTELTADEKIESITYFDGLGRPKQSIAKQAGGNKRDIIKPIVYDDYGRQIKEYLPFPEALQSSGSLNYRDQTSILNGLNGYYSFMYPSDINTNVNIPNPFSEKRLEASPLNRVLEQGAPGTDWAVNKTADTDHTIKFGYGTNTVSDYVRKFSVSFQNGDTTIPQLVEDTEMVYDPSELYKTVTKDENWKPNQTYPKDHTTEEYKDKQGRVVLKRTFDSKRWLDTYYVYDDFGNLTYVIPPKVMTYSSILQPYIEQEFEYGWDLGEVFTNDSGYGNFSVMELDGKLDIYWYFGGNYSTSVFKNFVIPLNFTPALPNMAIGTINGASGVAASVFIQDGNLHIQSTGNPVSSADLEKYILLDLTDYQSNYTPSVINASILNGLCYQYKYDSRNRLVEKKIPGKGWEYIIYNKLDQPIKTQDGNMRSDYYEHTWLNTVYDAYGRVAVTGYEIVLEYMDSRTDQQNYINQNQSVPYVTKTISPDIIGINNTPVNYNLEDSDIISFVYFDDIYTINYYDDYTFDGFTAMPQTVFGQEVVNYNNGASTRILTKGLPTCSKVRVLDTNHWITTITGYDKKGRPIYVKSTNSYLGTTDIVETELDFTGKVLQAKTTHQKTGQPNNIVTVDHFEYDHAGRLIKQTQTLGSNTEVIAENHYDELGQLDNKGIGGKSTQGRLQTVDYSYNIRGWLKQINNPTTLGNDLFAFELNYNTPGHGATALYNGNISETEWRSNNDDTNLRWYKYSYDAINRLTQARDNANRYFVGGYYHYHPFIKYDRNGNIKSLARGGFNENANTYTTIDNLNYIYGDNGNHLLKVTDLVYGDAKGFGFKDGTNSGNDYFYDANGNMVSDANKGITSISYNHLNLPKTVNINDGGSNIGTISYIYDATGVKLEKKVSKSGTPDKYTYYAGNYVYENGSLKFFNHPEGYVDAVNGYKYVYQYKDHLGNVRLSYQDTNQNNSNPVSLEILEENNYYPFGMKHKGYNNTPLTNHPYKYQGVELNESLGLNLYEMDLRQYDPAIGRWTGIDPITHESQSTYAGMDNNPVFWADPSGAAVEQIAGGVRYTGEHAKLAFGALQKQYGGNDDGVTHLPPVYVSTKKGWNPTYQFAASETARNIYATKWYQRYYGQSGDGGFYDGVLKGMDEINQYNPIANLWDVLSYTFTGEDRFGNSMSTAEASLSAVSVVPVMRLSSTGVTATSATITTWNQFQKATAGQFASRSEAGLAWSAFKEANNIVPGTIRSQAQKRLFLREAALSGKYPKWMNQWLSKGKVPPGHHVDHYKALFDGGLDIPLNMRLKDISTHINRHRYYR